MSSNEAPTEQIAEQDNDYLFTVTMHQLLEGPTLYMRESWNDGSNHTFTLSMDELEKVVVFAAKHGFAERLLSIAQAISDPENQPNQFGIGHQIKALAKAEAK